MDELQGLAIQVDANSIKGKSGLVEIEGILSVYVNCGSQYSTWNQFPQTILYVLKDLDTGNIFESVNLELSISWDGNQVYDEYSKKPCNQVVTERFSTSLADISFINPSNQTITNFELHASYLGRISNVLVIKNAPTVLKNF